MTLPKFIITMGGVFRLGMVNQHKDLLKPRFKIQMVQWYIGTLRQAVTATFSVVNSQFFATKFTLILNF